MSDQTDKWMLTETNWFLQHGNAAFVLCSRKNQLRYAYENMHYIAAQLMSRRTGQVQNNALSIQPSGLSCTGNAHW